LGYGGPLVRLASGRNATIQLMRLMHRLRERHAPVGTVDRILEDELDEVGAGGGLAAANLPSQRFETVVEVWGDPIPAAAAFSEAMARLGRSLDGDLSGRPVTVSGVIGGGFMNMNPAVVEVRIVPQPDGGCRATLTGTAKEGLIKQGTGEKAVRRVLGAHELAGIRMREALSPPGT
jgi:hypothetical protein